MAVVNPLCVERLRQQTTQDSPRVAVALAYYYHATDDGSRFGGILRHRLGTSASAETRSYLLSGLSRHLGCRSEERLQGGVLR